MAFRVITDFDGKAIGVIEGSHAERVFSHLYIKIGHHGWISKIVTRAEYETYLAFGFEDLYDD